MNEDIAGRAVLMPEKAPPTPAEIAFEAGPKCGQCAHWHQQPQQKMDVAAMKASPAFRAAPVEQQRAALEQARIHNQGSLLNEERVGECRVQLLTIPITANDGGAPRLLGTICHYPGGIAAAFRACGQFRPCPETADEAKARVAKVLS